MIAMRAQELAEALGVSAPTANFRFHGVSTDSRQIKARELFFALRGPNFDGHDMLDEVERSGAAAAVVERSGDWSIPHLVVDDSRAALGDLARAWRKRFSIPVIGVTGSNGKTTVKEMLSAILGTQGESLATVGNLNNDIGVPLTLFRLGEQHRSAVVEMGANHVGEIERLAAIAGPTVAVITLCAPAHLEGFGSIERVAQAKGEIYDGLAADGVAIINADDDYCEYWENVAAPRKIIRFGMTDKADVTASNVAHRGIGLGSVFDVDVHGRSLSIESPFDGPHNVMNALAAVAAADAIGIDIENIKRGLESAQKAKGRLNVDSGLGNCRVIDDTYNANPASLNAAMELLANEPGRRILVIGDMGELGPEASNLHRRAGEHAASIGIDRLLTLGPLSRNAAEAFGAESESFDDIDDLCARLRELVDVDTTVLVKGSRTMQMERVVVDLVGART